ncbi:hypothetical protein PUN28_009271 [Cardiocondyla obscurior]|uniref:Uncharacterized protein n=1 Tax=Cardiocondyla obscurior TaxID=286306 RepID=A0AAW2FTM1_9HYME
MYKNDARRLSRGVRKRRNNLGPSRTRRSFAASFSSLAFRPRPARVHANAAESHGLLSPVDLRYRDTPSGACAHRFLRGRSKVAEGTGFNSTPVVPTSRWISRSLRAIYLDTVSSRSVAQSSSGVHYRPAIIYRPQAAGSMQIASYKMRVARSRVDVALPPIHAGTKINRAIVSRT